jgi:hypothetical protein
VNAPRISRVNMARRKRSQSVTHIQFNLMESGSPFIEKPTHKKTKTNPMISIDVKDFISFERV